MMVDLIRVKILEIILGRKAIIANQKDIKL